MMTHLKTQFKLGLQCSKSSGELRNESLRNFLNEKRGGGKDYTPRGHKGKTHQIREEFFRQEPEQER